MAEVNDIAFLCVRLRELREKNDCNMEELAEKININCFKSTFMVFQRILYMICYVMKISL